MYENLLEKYKVVPDSVWEFDKGLLVCGSNLSPKNQKHIPIVGSVYTDPPQYAGGMKKFYRYANLEVETSYFNFMEGVFELIKQKTRINSTVFFDAGKKQTYPILENIEKKGWHSKNIFTTYYEKRPKPCNTVVGSFWGTSIIPSDLTNKYGQEKHILVTRDLINMGYKELFDPCCGCLDFLLPGLKMGMEFVCGIELIPEKMALGLKRIEALGYKAKRVL